MIRIKNLLTIDIEDWYQSSLELFDEKDRPNKIAYPTDRVIINTNRILELLKELDTKATFFVLGTVAERYPELVVKIEEQGHEIATHGYAHKLVYKQTKEEFRHDLRKSINIIENITKDKVLGYRAPYFSIRADSMWAFDILREEGLKYDASIFPLKRKLYGVNDINKINTNGVIEFPVSKISFLGYEFPFSGGGYLRLFPYVITRWAIRKLNKQRKLAVVYIHPYEIDTEDSQDYGLGNTIETRFTLAVQRYNREKTEDKIKAMLRDFRFTRIKDHLNYR